MSLMQILLMLLISNFCCGRNSETPGSCSALPPKLTFAKNDTLWSYKPREASLSLNFDNFLFFSRDWCSISEYVPYFQVDLISTNLNRENLKDEKSREAARGKCRRLNKGSYVQSSAILHVNKTVHTFHYVQGMYYMRLSACPDSQCRRPVDLICSPALTLAADVPKNKDVCEYDFPSNVSADIIDTGPRFYRLDQDLDELLDGSTGANQTDNWFCDIALRAVIPLCTAHQSYDTVTVTAVELGQGTSWNILGNPVEEIASYADIQISSSLRFCSLSQLRAFSYLDVLTTRNFFHCVRVTQR